MKICIVTYYTPNYSSMGKITEINRESYCLQHGYDFYCPREDPCPGRHPFWAKIKVVEAVLSKYDWVFWTDIDALIMNQDITVESLLDKYANSETSLIVTRDCSGFNSGNFLIKNSEWSHDYLKRVYNRTDCLTKATPEQTAMFEEMDNQHVVYVKQSIMNSYIHSLCGHKYQHGDFILHLAGMRCLPREKIMRRYVNNQKALNNDQNNIYLGLLIIIGLALAFIIIFPSKWVLVIGITVVVIILYEVLVLIL